MLVYKKYSKIFSGYYVIGYFKEDTNIATRNYNIMIGFDYFMFVNKMKMTKDRIQNTCL